MREAVMEHLDGADLVELEGFPTEAEYLFFADPSVTATVLGDDPVGRLRGSRWSVRSVGGPGRRPAGRAQRPPDRRAARPVAGGSADECNAVGERLVAGGHLSQESFETVSATTNGDLLKFVTLLLSHHGVGRNELAAAVAAVCDVPVADISMAELDEEIVARFPEQVARTHKVMPIAEV